MILTPILGQAVFWFQTENGASVMVMGSLIHTECGILHESLSNTAASAIVVFFGDCIFSSILWVFYKVFKDIRTGDVFNQQQIKRICFSGWCFISLSIYSIISDMYLYLPKDKGEGLQFYFQINNLYYIPIGVGLVIFSHILRLATKIKEEQELVI